MKRWIAVVIVFALGLLGVGCGSDDSSGTGTGTETATPVASLAEVEIDASGADDERVATELQDYLVRMCPRPGTQPPGKPDVCAKIVAIEVDDGRVTLHTDLKGDEARMGGYLLCLLIASSDAADLVAGHELQDAEGETIKVCPKS